MSSTGLPRILLYNGEGTSPVFRQAFERAVRTWNGATCHYVECKELAQWETFAGASLFFMPGGADRYYARDLQGSGNRNIRRFVQEGGAYLGICAGVYYGASSIEFDKGGSLEVTGDRELAFFSGCARGPVVPGFAYDFSSHRSGAAAMPFRTLSDRVFYAYYQGGCGFLSDRWNEQQRVLAYYDFPHLRTLPAIVECHCGLGCAILSGVHFEISIKELENGGCDDPKNQEINEILRRTDGDREYFFQNILSYLLHRSPLEI